MKKFILIISAALILFSVSAVAQNQKKDWRDKMKAEKIAFLTNAVELTPSEAEAFWPVYNKCEEEKNKAFHTMMGTFKALDDAIKAGKDEKEISTLLDKYLNATQGDKGIDKKYSAEYRKILSSKKVAKLFIAEEEFRRQQIFRLNKGDKRD